MRDDNKGRRQRRPRVEFPDEAVALCLPVEVAVVLHFAESVAGETRGQRSLEANEDLDHMIRLSVNIKK